MGIGHVLRVDGEHVDRSQPGSVTLPLVNGICLTNINALIKNKFPPASGAAPATPLGGAQVTLTASKASASRALIRGAAGASMMQPHNSPMRRSTGSNRFNSRSCVFVLTLCAFMRNGSEKNSRKVCFCYCAVCVRPYNFTPDGGSEIFIS
jgi:hypothetical protein